MSAYFITSTGTDIGKTWLACALLRHWHIAGRNVAAFKPVLSGYSSEAMAHSDAGLLLAAMGREITEASISEITPWRFAAPLSPDMAAARENRTIDFAALVRFSRLAAAGAVSSSLASASPALIEGVGGVMAPLDANHTVRDWVAETALPAVLVAGSYLGSLSHTLTALQALRARHVPVAVIALNETADATVTLDETRRSLSCHAGKVAVVPIRRDSPAASIAHLADMLERMPPRHAETGVQREP